MVDEEGDIIPVQGRDQQGQDPGEAAGGQRAVGGCFEQTGEGRGLPFRMGLAAEGQEAEHMTAGLAFREGKRNQGVLPVELEEVFLMERHPRLPCIPVSGKPHLEALAKEDVPDEAGKFHGSIIRP